MKLILISFIITFLLSCNGRQVMITGLEGKPLPSFNFLLLDSTTILNSGSIPADKPFVLFYFNPNCPYCRAQTEDLTQSVKSQKDIRYYMFSNYPIRQIKKFSEHYGLNKYNNITTAQVNDTLFDAYYKIPGVPYMAIYSKEKKLKEVMMGIVSPKVIKEIAIK